MKLKRRRPAPARPDWYDDWPLLPPADLVGSDAARRFDDALRRFVAGEIPGRSFLIAGHRGAGKTTLVRNAAEQLTREIFGRLVNDATAGIPADSLAAIPQRPLLVRVNGPSLILEELPGPGAGEGTPAPAEPASAAPKAETQKARNPPHGPAAPSTKKQSILVQLTTALYRALARECAAAFAIHARAMDIADAAEVAGQLQLALDEAPDPALLRAYWQKFDALEQGVFFPRAIGRAFVDARFTGQGLREIVAIATAAQIFEVAAGKVAFSRIKKDSSKVAQEAGKASADAWSEALRKLFGFAVGAGLGGGAAAGLNFSGTASLLAGLAGGLASGWTSSLSRTREDTLDYKVTLDRSEASLERDLPLALDRIRAAGFAPVFLIDELDKLDEGTDGTGYSEGKAGKRDIETTMSELILRMKQLTTDYGFFCFLVDRSYFDRVQGKIERETYPIEYSFFSERLYVSPSAADFGRYAESLYDLGPPVSGEEGPPDQVTHTVFTKYLLHQCKLNMLALTRGIDAVEEIDTLTVLSDPRYRLGASIQMAIETMLADPTLAGRAAQDLSFGQLLVDALYFVSRALERGATEVRLDDDSVATALVERMYKARISDGKQERYEPRKRLVARIGERDTTLLISAARKLAHLLADNKNLSDELEALNRFSDQVLEIVTSFDPPILLSADKHDNLSVGRAWVYKFQYDKLGISLVDGIGFTLDNDKMEEITRLLSFGDALVKGDFPGAEFRLDDLILVGFWPSSLSIGVLTKATKQLPRAISASEGYAGFSSDMSTLDRARRALRESLPDLALFLPLAIALGYDAGIDSTGALRRMLRIRDFKDLLQPRGMSQTQLNQVVDNLPEFCNTKIPSDEDIAKKPDVFVRWTKECRNFTEERARCKFKPEGIWARCAKRLLHLLKLPILPPLPNTLDLPNRLDYDDLLAAVKEYLPIPFVHPEHFTPGSLPAADWSFLALEALTTSANLPSPAQPNLPVPAWMAVPALFVLGFGSSLLKTLADEARKLLQDAPDAAALRLLDKLPERANPNTPRGIAVSIADDAAPGWLKSPKPNDPTFFVERESKLWFNNSWYRRPSDTPVFPVRASQIPLYDTALTMLTKMEAFQGIFDELGE